MASRCLTMTIFCNAMMLSVFEMLLIFIHQEEQG